MPTRLKSLFCLGCALAFLPLVAAPTQMLLFFDAGDFARERSGDAIRDIAFVLTRENVVGHFALAGSLAGEIAGSNRQDVMLALHPHKIGVRSPESSTRPEMGGSTVLADGKAACGNALAEGGRDIEMLKKVFNRKRIDFAVPSGDGISYAAMYAFADLGCRFYASGGPYGDPSRPEQGGGAVPSGGRRWRMWFCNLRQLPYSDTLDPEESMTTTNRPAANPGQAPDTDAWLDRLAKEEAAILHLRPHLADVDAFCANLRALIRKVKADKRFAFTDVDRVWARNRLRMPIKRSMIPELRRRLQHRFGPISAPAPYSVADVFQAVCTLLRGEEKYVPGKVYGFLDRPVGVKNARSVKTADLRAAAKKLDLSTFVPATIPVGGQELGPADFLFAALDALATGSEEVTVVPREQLGSCRDMPSPDDRLELQLWTVRFE